MDRTLGGQLKDNLRDIKGFAGTFNKRLACPGKSNSLLDQSSWEGDP